MRKESFRRDPIENFEAQFKKATLSIMVLSYLEERDMYAYEIMQTALQRSNGVYKMPLLSNTLSKLKEQGYVTESKKMTTEDNRLRIYHSITDAGRAYLDEMKALYAVMDRVIWETLYGKDLGELYDYE